MEASRKRIGSRLGQRTGRQLNEARKDRHAGIGVSGNGRSISGPAGRNEREQTWLETVLNFGRWFRLAAGRVDSLSAEAARRGRRWLQGVSHSRSAFA